MPSTTLERFAPDPNNAKRFVNFKEGPPFGNSLESYKLCKATFTVNEGRGYKFLFQANLLIDVKNVECQITFIEGDVNEIEIWYIFNPIVEAFGGSLRVDLGQVQPLDQTITLVKGVHSSWHKFPVPDDCIEPLRNDQNMRNLIRNHLEIGIIKQDLQESPRVESITDLSLQARFASLFLNEDMSDLKILCDKKEFPVHTFILSVRSIVFKAMFASQFKEATSRTLKIENTDAKTMEKFLRFLYTDQLKQEELDCPLLLMADQYQVDSLTNQCIQKLRSKMDSENVLETFYTAYLISNEELMKVAGKYIRSQNGVEKPPFWKELKDNNHELAFKVLERITFG